MKTLQLLEDSLLAIIKSQINKRQNNIRLLSNGVEN